MSERVARGTEKLKVRKAGMGFYVDIHVQANPGISLYEAHILSGRVKSAMRAAIPAILGVIIHMKPFENRSSSGA
jgi:divalent metal cation (Fe/Co/Zn/Cd) transporter